MIPTPKAAILLPLGKSELVIGITLAQLKKLIADAHFHFLCANVTDNATPQPLTKRYEVRQVGAARVGIFGLVTRSAGRSLAASQGLEVEDVFKTAPAIIAQLRGPEKTITPAYDGRRIVVEKPRSAGRVE